MRSGRNTLIVRRRAPRFTVCMARLLSTIMVALTLRVAEAVQRSSTFECRAASAAPPSAFMVRARAGGAIHAWHIVIARKHVFFSHGHKKPFTGKRLTLKAAHFHTDTKTDPGEAIHPHPHSHSYPQHGLSLSSSTASRLVGQQRLGSSAAQDSGESRRYCRGR